MSKLGRSATRVIQGSSFIYLLSRIIPAFLQLLSVTIFVRLLGSNGYGAYALVIALVFLTGNAGSTWLVQSILRYRTSLDTAASKAGFAFALRKGAWISALLVVLVLGGLLSFRQEGVAEVISALLAAVTLLHFSIVYAERQSDLQPVRILVAETLRGIFTLGVPVLLIWVAGWISYAPLLLGVAVGNGLGAVALRIKTQPVALMDGDRENRLLKQFARFGIPLTVWMGASLLLNVSDRFVIEWALGLSEVGVYSAVYDVVYKSTNLLLTPLLLASHPLIMKAWNTGEAEEAQRIIRQTMRMTLFLAAPMLVGWALAAPYFVRIVLGTAPAGTASLVVPVALGAIVWSMAVVVHKPLEMRNQTLVMCAFALVALGVQVLLNVLLLPSMGLVIAPWNMVAAALIYLICVWLCRHYGRVYV